LQTRVINEISGNRWELTLEPPAGKPPTLDLDVLRQLQSAIGSIEAALAGRREAKGPPPGSTPEPAQLVVLQSSAPKYFCVGANIGVLHTLSEDTMPEWVSLGQGVMNRLEDLPVPVVAKVRGYALGGGLELAMAADLIFCDSTAKLGQTEANLGFVPGWGGSFRLPRRVGVANAKRLFYTGEIVGAEAARAMGLADAVEKAEELDAFIDEFATAVSGKSHHALSAFKRILSNAERAARDSNDGLEREFSLACISNPDTKSRIAEFLNRRK
jgi:enoyl-CoA hydratase